MSEHDVLRVRSRWLVGIELSLFGYSITFGILVSRRQAVPKETKR